MVNIALEVTFSPKNDKVTHISAVKLDISGNVVSDFDTDVKQGYLDLDDYDNPGTAVKTFVTAPTLKGAVESLAEWVGEDSARMVTWHDFTFADLDREAREVGADTLPSDLGTNLVLEDVFSLLMGYRNQAVGLYSALAWCGKEANKTSGLTLGAAYDVASLCSSLLEDSRVVYDEAHHAMWSQSKACDELCRDSIEKEYLGIVYAHISLGEYAEAAHLLEMLTAYAAG